MTTHRLLVPFFALVIACGDADGSGGEGPTGGVTTGATNTDASSATVSSATVSTGDATTTGATSSSGMTLPEMPPELVFTDPPVDGLAAGVRFAEAVPYGPEDGQIMDVFLPESATPTAVVFFFHGGGFVEGSRTAAYSGSANALKQITSAGVAFVGVDYRLLADAGTETEGVIKCLHDSRRALQYVRHWAADFNIDPTRVGVYGSSAGAGTSLWLAYHDDMADPASLDLVLRESSRVQVASAISTQGTYDVVRWAPDIFGGEYPFLTNDLLLAQAQARNLIVRFYGLDGALLDDAAGIMAALETPEMLAYRADVDMFAAMSADDPDAYAQNAADNAAPGTAGFDLLHHPLHAKTLDERATAAGIVFEADVPAYDIASPASATDFLLDHLLP